VGIGAEDSKYIRKSEKGGIKVIIKTVKNINSPAGCIVSGVSFRAQHEGNGFKVTFGEFKGQYISNDAAIIISDLVLDKDGKIPRGQKYA
jgi:hypothetical protein